MAEGSVDYEYADREEWGCPLCGYTTVVKRGATTCPRGCPSSFSQFPELMTEAKEDGVRLQAVLHRKYRVTFTDGNCDLYHTDSRVYREADDAREASILEPDRSGYFD